MIVEHGARMDPCPRHDFRHHLVGSQILILLCKADIVPHHIVRIVQIAAVDILFFQPHRRQMVPVDKDDRRFPAFFYLFDHLAEHEVSLVHLIDIVFPLVAQARRLQIVKRDDRMLKHFFF